MSCYAKICLSEAGHLPCQPGGQGLVRLCCAARCHGAACCPCVQGRSDAPAGLSGFSQVEFEVLLLDFEREGYWQNMTWQERWQLAQRLKEKGNALFRDKKYAYATNK